MNMKEQLENKMLKLAEEYAFNYFNLENNDQRIPIYYEKRLRIQCALMKLNVDERKIIAFTYLFPENVNQIKNLYTKKEYEKKKNLALMSFFRCLK